MDRVRSVPGSADGPGVVDSPGSADDAGLADGAGVVDDGEDSDVDVSPANSST